MGHTPVHEHSQETHPPVAAAIDSRASTAGVQSTLWIGGTVATMSYSLKALMRELSCGSDGVPAWASICL